MIVFILAPNAMYTEYIVLFSLITNLFAFLPSLLSDAATLIVVNFLPRNEAKNANAFMMTFGSYIPISLAILSLLSYLVAAFYI